MPIASRLEKVVDRKWSGIWSRKIVSPRMSARSQVQRIRDEWAGGELNT
jgi:hypothetical protein